MIFRILLKTERNEVLPYLLPASSPTPFLVVEPPCVSLQRGGLSQQAHACGFFFNHISCFTKIRAHPSDSFAGRRRELNAHVLEVLLRFLPRVVVRQSIAWVVRTRDFLELDLPRTILFLKPQLLHLKALDLPSSSAGQDAFHC